MDFQVPLRRKGKEPCARVDGGTRPVRSAAYSAMRSRKAIARRSSTRSRQRDTARAGNAFRLDHRTRQGRRDVTGLRCFSGLTRSRLGPELFRSRPDGSLTARGGAVCLEAPLDNGSIGKTRLHTGLTAQKTLICGTEPALTRPSIRTKACIRA